MTIKCASASEAQGAHAECRPHVSLLAAILDWAARLLQDAAGCDLVAFVSSTGDLLASTGKRAGLPGAWLNGLRALGDGEGAAWLPVPDLVEGWAGAGSDTPLASLAALSLTINPPGIQAGAIGVRALLGWDTSSSTPDLSCLSAIGKLVAGAVEQRIASEQTEQALRAEQVRWSALYEMGVRLTHSLYGGDLVHDILRSSVDLLCTQGGRLVMYNQASDDLTLILSYAKSGPPLGEPGLRTKPGEGMAGQVYLQRRPLIVQDYASWPGRLPGIGPHSALGVPLLSHDGVLGVLILADAVTRTFTEDDTRLLTVFAAQIAAVLINAEERRRAEAQVLAEERSRLARDLHDGLAQDLAAILLCLDMGGDPVRPLGDGIVGELAKVRGMVQRGIQELRTTVLALHGLEAHSMGLEQTLADLAERFMAQTGIPVSFTTTGRQPAAVPVQHELTMARVAQEALSNVRAHARADRVAMDLAWPGSPALAPDIEPAHTLVLRISDNGRGFALDKVAGRRGGAVVHWGLLFMRERAEALGGQLLITSQPGSGTSIVISLPLPA